MLWTFFGIKLLQEKFACDKAKWKLVVSKSKKYLAKKLGVQSINDLLAMCIMPELM